MSNNSILEQIIMNRRAEEVANLDAVEIINNLFGELSERERDVLIRRFGLRGQSKETLEKIGKIHELTRERIRQIETSSIKKLRQLENLENYISNLKNVIVQLLEEHGGLMEKDYLLKILAAFSLRGSRPADENQDIHKNYLNFLITQLLYKEFEELANSKHFLNSYKLKYRGLDHFAELVDELYEKIKEEEKVYRTEEIINLIKNLESYKKHEEKFSVSGDMEISEAIKDDLYEENFDIINRNKALYTLLKSAKKIDQNRFGGWGRHNSRAVKPKTINDKIYLILQNKKKPLHFAEIADLINSIAFDRKKANAATVHNELILDKKYVLVGRGLYGLKEWGYNDGTVADVVEEILKGEGAPLEREEIIKRVLDKRMVKKTTIILALMRKDKFEKVDGKYRLMGMTE